MRRHQSTPGDHCPLATLMLRVGTPKPSLSAAPAAVQREPAVRIWQKQGVLKGLVCWFSASQQLVLSLMPLHTSGTVRSGLGVTNHPLVQRTTPGWQSHPTRRLGSLSACTSRLSHTFPRACHEHQLFQQGKLTARLQHRQGFSNFF